MSADNGIYIGVFPKTNNLADCEYRVIEAQAIDNISFFPEEMDSNVYEGENPRAIVEYFGEADVLSETVASSKAFEMEREIKDSEFPA